MKEKQCEICGKKAIVGVRDIKQSIDHLHGCMDSEPDGPPHFFCDEHTRRSHIREVAPELAFFNPALRAEMRGGRAFF
jgi:hypothetical protein